ELLIAMRGGIRQFSDGKSEAYAIPGGTPFSANRLLRDHDGGLWIGTIDQGLIHVHQGRTDVFSKSDGLSGDVIFSLFEDREGSVWVSTNGGLDRFRDLAVSTISIKQGLSNEAAWAILAARDGSVWVGSRDGLNQWNNGQISMARKAGAQSDDAPQSLFQDERGRIWAFTGHGLVYVDGDKPAALHVDKSMSRERPDAPAFILKERLRRIIRLCAGFAGHRNLSVIPLVQTIATPNPYAAIPRS